MKFTKNKKFITLLISCVLSVLFLNTTHADEPLPHELSGIGIDEKTGQKINLNLPFTDEAGKQVLLKEYFKNQKPVIVALVYFGCPNLCTMVLNATIDTLNKVNLKPGDDFEVVAISFDHKETPTLAAEKKLNYLKTYRNPQTHGFHFLTAKESVIKEITSQMGFKFKWDKDQEQYAHASAIYVLTAEGVISRLHYGIMYPPQDVKLSLLEAAQGKIGNIVDRFLLYCYHYDAANKKYALVAKRIMSLGGGLTLALLGVFMAIFWINEYRNTPKGDRNVV